MQSNYLMMDETTMKVMDKDKKGTTHRGYFWAAQAPPTKLVFFEYQPGRNQEVPQALLSDYKGYLQSDGYSCYETLAANQNIELLCCMAHARRYFMESEKNDPKRAAYALNVLDGFMILSAKSRIKPLMSAKKPDKSSPNPYGYTLGNGWKKMPGC